MRYSLTIQFDSENDAVVTNPAEELAQAAERIARRVREGDRAGSVLDTNGNTSGAWVVRGVRP